MTAAKVELGRYLFYDTRMSVNGKSSCATCHKQELAFTDGLAVAVGATGELHSRSAMSLVNVAYSGALTWSNPELRSAGATGAGSRCSAITRWNSGCARATAFFPTLRSDAQYRGLFERAFPGDAESVSPSAT